MPLEDCPVLDMGKTVRFVVISCVLLGVIAACLYAVLVDNPYIAEYSAKVFLFGVPMLGCTSVFTGVGLFSDVCLSDEYIQIKKELGTNL